ncbi:hypothetical protein CNBG_2543 [Cryptococcus deuterogattii R265]|uniref:Zf-C3HC-domain-containing protein n=1 Tax=Cryptococcus deuterogattii (strain R265) TaxID=294750 RepID=A0A095C7N7_CRYD2|nr:hypothetical protein CNBG_2543 [Cryptococcus deuterogattii R265]KIR69984.1 hypothetical protein I310_06305 [Cryptococcus deuterogattii CA1014]
MEGSPSTDADLRDVFKLLYADDDWALTSDSELEDSDHLSNTDGIDIELTDNEEQLPIRIYSARITKKRLFSALDSLFSQSYESTTKRQRIYNPPAPSVPSLILSTQPIPVLPLPKTYAPFSALSLLSRLLTFQPYTYFPQYPPGLSPVRAATKGWVNEGREGLKCEVCGEKWGLGGLQDVRNEEMRSKLGEKLAKGFEERHKKNCAWRICASPENLYEQLRHLIHPPITSSLAPLASHLSLECLTLTSLRFLSPLNSVQVERLANLFKPSLMSSISSATIDVASQLALFGWFPYHPNNPAIQISLDTPPSRTEIVCCRICHRRIGLWNFSNEKDGVKQFDVLNEHLVWCPIRIQDGEKEWWSVSGLLGGQSTQVKRIEEGDIKDLVKISERMEKRSWRRS